MLVQHELEFVSATVLPDDIGDYIDMERPVWRRRPGSRWEIDLSATFKAVGGGDA